MNTLLLILMLILLVFDIYVLKRNKKIFYRKIRNENKILFYKLQKQYLNNSSIEDVKDLISFLYNYYIERNKKK